MKNIQHKKEAYWFYRFLSIFYDHYVNPFFWTKNMRAKALALANLDRDNLLTLDAGSGTGFTTQGIAEFINTQNITCLDQSPHQMAKAKKKEDLNGCTFILGDAENLPFATDHFDRYVSAGSIEYWPDPQRGIAEAYRVLKPGGIALMIGPLKPKNTLAKLFANIWMLFPAEDEYLKWFREAGFTNLKKTWVAPNWVLSENYAIALSGTKAAAGLPLVKYNPATLEKRDEPMGVKRFFLFMQRLLIGSFAGFIFIPMALFGLLRFHLLRLFGFNTRNAVIEEPAKM